MLIIALQRQLSTHDALLLMTMVMQQIIIIIILSTHNIIL
jgi:hypothetical protein